MKMLVRHNGSDGRGEAPLRRTGLPAVAPSGVEGAKAGTPSLQSAAVSIVKKAKFYFLGLTLTAQVNWAEKGYLEVFAGLQLCR